LHQKRIVNASPLILLSKLDHLDLLQVEAVEVIVPDRVIDEIRAYGATDLTVQTIQKTPWLQIVPTPLFSATVTSWNLGDGETSVLSVALGEPGAQVVLDDRPDRRRASQLGIEVLGTVGLVVLARQKGAIPAARPVIEELRRVGMYLTDELVKRIYDLVGE
jgi:predicted nucleic acid-binding protein